MKFLLVTLILVTFTAGVLSQSRNYPCDGCYQRVAPATSSKELTILSQQVNNAMSYGNQETYVNALLCWSAMSIRVGEVLNGIDSLNRAYQVTLNHDLDQLLPFIELAYARACLLSNNLQQASLHFSRAAGQCLAVKDSAGYAQILQTAGEAAFLLGQYTTASSCFTLSIKYVPVGMNGHFRSLAGLVRADIALGDTAAAHQHMSAIIESPIHSTDSVYFGFMKSEWLAMSGKTVEALSWLDTLQRLSGYFPDMKYAFSMNRRNVLAGCGRFQDAILEGAMYESFLDSLNASGYTLSIQKKLDEAEAYYISQRVNHDQGVFDKWKSRVAALTSYVILLGLLVIATVVTLGFLFYSWSRKREEAVSLRNEGLHQMAELHRSNRHLKEFGRLSGQALKGYLLDLKAKVAEVNRDAISSEHNRMVLGLVETALLKLERLLGELDDILRYPDPRSLLTEKIRLDLQFTQMIDGWSGNDEFPAFSRDGLLPVVALGPGQYVMSILQNIGFFIKDYYRQNNGSEMSVRSSHEGDAAILTFSFRSNRPFDQPDMLFRFRSRVYSTTDPYTIYIYIAYMLTRSVGGNLRVNNVRDRNVLSLILPFESVHQDEIHSLEEMD